MPLPTDLAFLWHMHQPSYRDPETGAPLLPWVRLHCCRSYFDMAWQLARHPRIKATFNFVPVLLQQLEALRTGTTDHYATLTLKPADTLDAADRRFLVQHFFSVSHATEVRPRARYHALLNKRSKDAEGASFSVAELRDLQLLFNLAWMGFGARAEYPLLAELEARGRDFTEAHKAELLAVQAELVERTLPLYRDLAARGQIEITTTPARHPILPLIIDSEHAARCQPQRPRPPRFAWPEDARAHVSRAVQTHTAIFGIAPAGAWPAEGSVSPEAVQVLAEGGLKWLASDEAQLFGGLSAEFPRAPLPHHLLYQPFRVWGGGLNGVAPSPATAVDFVFRDRTLSDRIGFTYAHNPPEAGVADLLARVRQAQPPRPGHPALIVAALDGENPWEHYPHSGLDFLEALYTALEAAADVRTVRVSDHLSEHPPGVILKQLKTGSWINGDFSIWMGGAMENRAWTLLGEARQAYADALATRGGKSDEHTPSVDFEAAYDHLLDAESSDWFWWYGEPFTSDNDRDFDALFRGHLQQAWRLMGLPVPAALGASLYPPVAAAGQRTPQGRVSPRYGSQSTYFDWLGAGEARLGGAGGSMYRAARWFERLRYGFDTDRLALRLDAPPKESAEQTASAVLNLEVHWRPGASDGPFQIHGVDLHLDAPGATWVDGPPGALAGAGQGYVELGIPLAALGARPGEAIEVRFVLLADGVEVEQLPAEGAVTITLPDAAYDLRNWSV